MLKYRLRVNNFVVTPSHLQPPYYCLINSLQSTSRVCPWLKQTYQAKGCCQVALRHLCAWIH